jgi:anti-sigma B factor antagonist
VRSEDLPTIELRLRTARLDEGIFLIEVQGELDLYSSADLMRAVEQVVAREPSAVVIDLSRTTFIDSTGLGVLVAGTKLMRDRGDELHLAGTTPATTAALTSAGLESFFSVSPTVADAISRAAAQ